MVRSPSGGASHRGRHLRRIWRAAPTVTAQTRSRGPGDTAAVSLASHAPQLRAHRVWWLAAPPRTPAGSGAQLTGLQGVTRMAWARWDIGVPFLVSTRLCDPQQALLLWV